MLQTWALYSPQAITGIDGEAENVVRIFTKFHAFMNLLKENIGLMKRMQGKVTYINSVKKLLFVTCIIHQEVLCKLVLKINHAHDVVTKL